MIPQQHRQESLHRAYITAVAAQAGVKVSFSAGMEYGVDIMNEVQLKKGKL